MHIDYHFASPVGIWVGSHVWRHNQDELVAIAPELEEMGYASLWIGGLGSGPGTPGSAEDLKLFRRLLEATDQMVVATGVLNTWLNPAADVTRFYRQLSSKLQARALLGFGAGHADQLDGTGQQYKKPYSAVLSYLDELDKLPEAIPRNARCIAALGPRMLRLAAERTCGAHPYLVTARYIEQARELMGPTALMAPELRAVVCEDPVVARDLARKSMHGNIVRDNYRNSFLRQGFTEESFADGGTNELVDQLVAWGNVGSIANRLTQQLKAGADHVPVQFVPKDAELPVDSWRSFAPEIPGIRRKS
jgi:probable F420-dependent oxidoreductase